MVVAFESTAFSRLCEKRSEIPGRDPPWTQYLKEPDEISPAAFDDDSEEVLLRWYVLKTTIIDSSWLSFFFKKKNVFFSSI